MTCLTRRYRFSASHRLHSPELSVAENARLYGKCNHAFGHGHDYTLAVSVAGPVDAVTGLLLPIATLDRLVDESVVRLFANRNINLDLAEFATVVPTTENIASYIVSLLQQQWSAYVNDAGVQLTRVDVQETDRNGFSILVRTPAAGSKVRHSEKIFVHA
jgi:6-pyruvoyltetrahydropterin/6-carboxytetrahydropterin synthase